MTGIGRRRGGVRLLLAGTAALAMVVPATAATADPTPIGSTAPVAGVAVPAPGVTVPVIHWAPCAGGGGLQCATVAVPLDYDHPTGPRTTLAVNRLPALDPAHRLGSVFLNPGGPGGSGVDMVQQVAFPLSLALRGRFDVVGFDPRGIARSSPLVCFANEDEFTQAVASWPYPLGASEEARQQQLDDRYAHDCSLHATNVIDHMSTGDVARDLDLLRAAVGDSALTYVGLSYGTQIGTTYANLFPHRVRAMVIDGVLDPIAWTTGTPRDRAPFTYRLHSDRGAQATLGQFFSRCDRAATDTDPGTACEFGPHAAARFAALDLTLRLRPVDLGGGSRFTEPELVATTLGALYSPFAWPALAGLLSGLEHPDAPAGVAAARDTLAARLGVATGTDMPQTIEGFNAVGCADSTNPTSYLAWPITAAVAEATDGYFGRLWTWASSPCQRWPGRGDDRYAGPWRATTQNPVLVVGNRSDPATRYQGARLVSRLLPNSRLLTYAGWGHTAFLSGQSTCIDGMVTHYLLTREVPGVGTVCGIELDPFAAVPSDGQTAPGAGRVAPQPPHAAIGLPPAVRRALAG